MKILAETNLQKDRPEGWNEHEFTRYIENSWNNSLYVFDAFRHDYARIGPIDAALEALHRSSDDTDTSVAAVPPILLIHSLGAYRAAILVGLSMPAHGYTLLRSMLECAGYAFLIYRRPETETIWFEREKSERAARICRATFTAGSIKRAISEVSSQLEINFSSQYEECIAMGAHPNIASLAGSLVEKEDGRIGQRLMSNDPSSHQMFCRTARWCGIVALSLYSHIFPSRVSSGQILDVIAKSGGID